MVPHFGFVTKTVLITQGCFSYSWTANSLFLFWHWNGS